MGLVGFEVPVPAGNPGCRLREFEPVLVQAKSLDRQLKRGHRTVLATTSPLAEFLFELGDTLSKPANFVPQTSVGLIQSTHASFEPYYLTANAGGCE
jgi:hypothetical protein